MADNQKLNVLNRKELFMTFSPEAFAKVTEILRKNGIAFETTSKYTGSHSKFLGSLGENTAVETQYRIWVSKSDFEKASYLLKSFF